MDDLWKDWEFLVFMICIATVSYEQPFVYHLFT